MAPTGIFKAGYYMPTGLVRKLRYRSNNQIKQEFHLHLGGIKAYKYRLTKKQFSRSTITINQWGLFMKKRMLLSIVGSIGLFAGAQSAVADEWDALALKEDIASATKEIDKAKALGFEWRDSRKLLKKAKQINAEGDYDKAKKLVAKAKKQGQVAVAQAHDQRNAGPH